MTEQLAEYYRRLLEPELLPKPLPFLERIAGLTRPYERNEPNGEETILARTPLPVTFTEPECEGNHRYLVPSADTAGIAYFEDRGTVPYTIAQNISGWQSTLLLVLWLNPDRLEGEVNEAAILNALDRTLRLRHRVQRDPFRDLISTYTVLPGGASLLSSYTYNNSALLYPPYRVIALEIRSTYYLAPDCYNTPLPTLKDATVCTRY